MMARVAWFRVQPVMRVAILCVGTAGCATRGAPDLALRDLIIRNTQARGGSAAIEAIRNLEVKLRIVEPTYTADGVWRVDRSGRMRIDVFIEKRRVFTEAFDGEHAWQLPAEAEHAVLANAGGGAALRHSGQLPTNILGLHEMAAHGHRLDSAGREEVGGVRYYVVVLTLDDGFVTRYYIDPTSFLITRSRVYKPLHPDLDPTPTTIETVWSDFRWIAGVRFGFEAIDNDLATGKVLQTTMLLDVTPNLPVDNRLFRMP
jgi:hypothetical protein